MEVAIVSLCLTNSLHIVHLQQWHFCWCVIRVAAIWTDNTHHIWIDIVQHLAAISPLEDHQCCALTKGAAALLHHHVW